MKALGVNCAIRYLGETSEQAAPLKGKSFVFTGGLESISRQEAAQRLQELGGRVTSSVSKRTAYVVVGKDSGVEIGRGQTFGDCRA